MGEKEGDEEEEGEEVEGEHSFLEGSIVTGNGEDFGSDDDSSNMVYEFNNECGYDD